MAALNFDATTVPPSAPREPIPAGKYECVVVGSDMKATRSGGQYLEIEYQVESGEHRGRKLWDRLNLDNPNQQAVEIAQRTLSAICHAVGKLRVSDSVELHGRRLAVHVKLVPAGPDRMGIERDAKNEVSGYSQIRPAADSKAAAPAAAYPPWKVA